MDKEKDMDVDVVVNEEDNVAAGSKTTTDKPDVPTKENNSNKDDKIDPEESGENSDSSDSDDSENDNEEEQERSSKPDDTNHAGIDALFGEFYFADSDKVKKSLDSSECTDLLKAEAEKWLERDACSTALVNTEKHFVCVKYPCVVRNVDKALVTLGGTKQLLESLTKNMWKVELKFRPGDPYCKPTIGSYKKDNHLLLRCRRRKVRDVASGSSDMPGSSDGYEYKVEVIGIVDGILSFNRPCDFQYLPVVKKSEGGDGGYKEILSNIIIKYDDEREDYLNRDVPLFLPPNVFSRAERFSSYSFLNDDLTEHDFIGRSRKNRTQGTVNVFFTDKEIPMGPNQIAKDRHCNLLKSVPILPLVKLFEERPLWSRTAVLARLRAEGKANLQPALNMVAYLCANGPWIHLWCRYGYDPRIHKEAKMYQNIVFRIRKIWNRELVTAKRSNHVYKCMSRRGLNPYHGHMLPPMQQLASAVAETKEASTSKDGTNETEVDVLYQFVPDRLPPYRQICYQVCDIFEEKVQELAHLNDGQETECSERDGWFLSDFLTMARDIMTERIQPLLHQVH